MKESYLKFIIRKIKSEFQKTELKNEIFEPIYNELTGVILPHYFLFVILLIVVITLMFILIIQFNDLKNDLKNNLLSINNLNQQIKSAI